MALLGNIGLYQAVRLGVDGVRRLVDAIGADGMALHLNAGQELTQPEGDRDFRGGYRVVEELVRAFGDRLLVKETGCGIGPEVARRLVGAGRAATWTCPGWAAPRGCAWSSCARTGVAGRRWAPSSPAGASPPRRPSPPCGGPWGRTCRLVASGGIRARAGVGQGAGAGRGPGGHGAAAVPRAAGGRAARARRQALEVVLAGLRQALRADRAAGACAELRQRPAGGDW